MKFKLIIAAMATVIAICSCDKSDPAVNDGKTSSEPIRFGDVKVRFSDDTKADCPERRKVGEIHDGLVSLTVEETVSSMDGAYQTTKADATTTATLGSFTVEGFLDPEIREKEGADQADKDNLHFISGALVTGASGSSSWQGSFSDEYKWRFGTHHHFWATPNAISLNIDQDTFDKAEFSYTSDGDEDVILAYTNRYFGKDEDTADKDPALHLTFKHALSAVKINSANLQFKKRKAGEADEPVGNYPSGSTTPRCEITDYEVRGMMDSGDCEYDGADFFWSNLSCSVTPAAVNLLADNEPQFLIPQDRAGAILHIEMIDRQRQMIRPFVCELKDLFGTSEWLAGHQYEYNLKGEIIVPKLPEGQTGIDANFSGKGFKSLSIINSIPGKYISKIKLSWKGVVAANPGNGSYYMISIEPQGTEPSDTYLNYVNDPELLRQHHIGFCVDHKAVNSGDDGLKTYHSAPKELSYVGEYDPRDYQTPAGQERLKEVECWCIIDVPQDMQDFDVYAVFNGGQSGDCNWHLSNAKLEVLEWR